MTNNDCIFCQIIAGPIPSTIRYQDETFIAFNDIHPLAPTHVLIVPKEHLKSLETIDLANTDLQAELLITARKVAQELGIQDNYKLFMNVGDKVQQVHHLHLHLYGGWDQQKSRDDLDQESLGLITA
jgi:histidine triad (HIT) family protein